jgi:hypothetical protein
MEIRTISKEIEIDPRRFEAREGCVRTTAMVIALGTFRNENTL